MKAILRTLVLASLMTFFGVIPAIAQPASDIELVGRLEFETTNNLGDVAYKDGYVYNCFNTGEVKVFDYRDPSAPRFIRSLRLWDAPQVKSKIKVIGDVAVVLMNRIIYEGTNVWLIDIANPAEAALIAQQEIGYYDIRVIATDSRYLYTSSLHSIDMYQLVDRDRLEHLSTYELSGSATSISPFGNKLAVSCWGSNQNDTAGFELLDISNPRSPQRSVLHQGEDCMAIFLQEDYCVAFDWYPYGVRNATLEWVLYDIRDLGNITRITQYPNPTCNPWLWGNDQLLWIGGTSEFEVIDVSNPAEPELAFGIVLPEPIPEDRVVSEIIGLSDNNLFIRHGLWFSSSGLQLESYWGMSTYDISNRRNVHLLNRYSRYGYSTSLLLNANTAYVTMENWISIVDLQDPSQPTEIGLIPLEGVEDLFQNDEGVLFAGLRQGGIVAFDVEDPSTPQRLGSIGGYGQPPGEILNGIGYVFKDPYVYEIGNIQPEFYRIISIEDPSNVVEVGRMNPLNNHLWNAVIEGDRMYAINGQNLFAISLEDPTSPRALGLMTWTQPIHEIYGHQGHLFAMPNRSWLLEFDVSDPQNIHKIVGRGIRTRTPVDGQGNASMMKAVINDESDFICIADGSAGVRLFHNDWNRRPVEVGYYDPEGNVIDVAFGRNENDNQIIYAINATSLFVLGAGEAMSMTSEIAAPSAFSLSISPNPFNGRATVEFSLPRTGLVHAAIYDLEGRKVLDLANQPFSAGSHSLGIELENEVSGVYFLKVEANGRNSSRKIVLMR